MRAREMERSVGNQCACGCGTPIPYTTRRGDPQRYAIGHNSKREKKRLDEQNRIRAEHHRILMRILSFPPRNPDTGCR